VIDLELKCIICGCHEFVYIKDKLRDSDTHKVVKCSNCGQVQLDPVPSIYDDKEFYDKDMQVKSIFKDIDIDTMKKKSIKDIKRRFTTFKEIANKEDNILEVGCGYGFYVQYTKNKGYNIEGIEVSESRYNYGVNELGCKIYKLNLLNEDIPNNLYDKYDIVFLFQVLEHISIPELFLKNIKKMLKKDGKLIVEVPNLDDHMLERSKEYNDFYFQRAHINYFDKFTVTNILEKSNFIVDRIDGVQRYDLNNALNWINKGKPQLEDDNLNSIEWIEEIYENKLIEHLKCDTLLAYCTNI
jgi:2-polyprenyl-3-methyl-5-hydroxy-6-metoxy-1,4-benzoquinol methylase